MNLKILNERSTFLSVIWVHTGTSAELEFEIFHVIILIGGFVFKKMGSDLSYKWNKFYPLQI